MDDSIFCARPYRHPGPHASPQRGGWWRRAGWWSWLDDGFHPEAELRDRVVQRAQGATPPTVAGAEEPVCRATGELWHVDSGGRIAPAVWSEPVRCARPVGHDLPHATTPRPRAVVGWPCSVELWQWWRWPAPALGEPTREQRRWARAQRLATALLLLAVLAWLILGAAGRS